MLSLGPPRVPCIHMLRIHLLLPFSSRQNLGTLPSAPLAVRWASVGGETFQVRGQDYMKSRVKEPSGPAIYRLLGADLFSFDQKIHNIAHHIDLPAPPRVSAAHSALPPEERLPLILIINLQLPSYVVRAGTSLVLPAVWWAA